MQRAEKRWGFTRGRYNMILKQDGGERNGCLCHCTLGGTEYDVAGGIWTEDGLADRNTVASFWSGAVPWKAWRVTVSYRAPSSFGVPHHGARQGLVQRSRVCTHDQATAVRLYRRACLGRRALRLPEGRVYPARRGGNRGVLQNVHATAS